MAGQAGPAARGRSAAEPEDKRPQAAGGRALARFNGLAPAEAERELRACCASPTWARAVAAGRPYADLGALTAAGGAAFARLEWGDLAEALAVHPRIGERPAGDDRAAEWSRAEQAGVPAGAAAGPQRAYEERFGHVFLIFATGRTESDIVAQARVRLGNDPSAERLVVREELRKITQLRLERLVA